MTPLAFLYDRRVSRDPAPVNGRLSGCRTYAARQGWEVAAEWVDVGDNALSTDRRPRLDALCRAMSLYATQRPVLCLVHHWDRLCRDPGSRDALCRRVARVGGGVATTFGGLDAHARNLLGVTGAPR